MTTGPCQLTLAWAFEVSMYWFLDESCKTSDTGWLITTHLPNIKLFWETVTRADRTPLAGVYWQGSLSGPYLINLTAWDLSLDKAQQLASHLCWL